MVFKLKDPVVQKIIRPGEIRDSGLKSVVVGLENIDSVFEVENSRVGGGEIRGYLTDLLFQQIVLVGEKIDGI